MSTPNSISILYNTSFLTESKVFLKSTNSWCTVSLYSHFFFSIWRMQKIWPVIDLLRRTPHWWSPIISTIYEFNLERRILNTILYEMIAVVSGSTLTSWETIDFIIKSLHHEFESFLLIDSLFDAIFIFGFGSSTSIIDKTSQRRAQSKANSLSVCI
jgi:hypothetical protein